jgi:GT2 family glycosyltransferase
MSPRPTVSVVAPFLGSSAELDRLVAALNRLQTMRGDELIVADNGTTESRRLESERVVHHPAGGVRSPGFARNRGAARATGDWLVFLDADTDPDPAILDKYFDPLPDDHTAILAGAIVDAPSGPGIVARHAAARGQMDQRVTLGRTPFPYAQTANCAVRRSAFVEVGGFDEAARAGEDADLCFRLAEHGWRIESRPAAVVEHRTRATLRAQLIQLGRHGAGAAWCEERHPGSFPAPRALGLAARISRSAARAGIALARGDRERAAFAALDAAEAVAFEAGRLLPNRARR